MPDAMRDIPRKAEGLLEREIDGEVFVMSPAGDLLHTFKDTARSIWKLIDGTRGIDSLRAAITEEYQVEDRVAFSDIETFLAELRGLSLLK